MVLSQSHTITASLESAIAKTKEIIKGLATEWEIANYPNFLKSCFMHKSSWDTMKNKYLEKILNAIISGKSQSFVVSFTGRFVLTYSILFLFC
jgi:hypothetical protein